MTRLAAGCAWSIEGIGAGHEMQVLIGEDATLDPLPGSGKGFRGMDFQPMRISASRPFRSGDIALGIPFNLAAYSLLTQVIAQQVGLELGEFAHTIIDAHIYIAPEGSETEKYDHLIGLKEQLTREPLALPRLKIKDKPLDELCFEDFELINYQHHDKITFEVAV